MGLRNPFRFAINRRTATSTSATTRPTPATANPPRGPAGHGRWMLIKKPANYGWPYCVNAEPALRRLRLRHQDLGRGRSTATRRPTTRRITPACGRSRRSRSPTSGTRTLASPHFPQLGPEGPQAGGIAPMGGPAYEPDEGNSRSSASRTTTTASRSSTSGLATTSRSSASNAPSRRHRPRSRSSVDNPMDMEFGPDGALYVLEYGDGYFAENPDAQLVEDQLRAAATARRSSRSRRRQRRAARRSRSSSPAQGTSDPDGDPLSYAWDFDADGKVDSHRGQPDATPTRRTATTGPTLRVTDRTGRSASAEVHVLVGNQSRWSS